MLYLEDPRLPRLAPAQRPLLYTKLERLLLEWLGYTVKLREVGARDLGSEFTRYDQVFARSASIIRNTDLDPAGPLGAEKLRGVIARDFRNRPLATVARYLRAGTLSSQAEAVDLAQRQFISQLDELRRSPLPDGQPFFNSAQARLNSFAHWAVLMEEITEADFVLTNSMIVGADQQMPIYVIARGGLTTGLTDNNDRSPYQTATMVGLFPFLSDAPVFLRERGRIPDAEILDVIATFCLHEMGHFFCRLAEHYDHPNCVHVAPTGLNYYTWHQAVRAAGPCRLVHQITSRF